VKNKYLILIAALLFFGVAPADTQADFTFSKTLRRGYSGEEVRQLQELLKTMPNIYPERLVTGYFGPLTQQAVRRFQTKHNIISSGDENTTGYGQVGPKTRKKLNEFLTSAPEPSSLNLPEPQNNAPQTVITTRKINPAFCPDNIYDEAEQKDPTLCPEDDPINNPKSIVAEIALQASSSPPMSATTSQQVSSTTTQALTTTQSYPPVPSSEEIFGMENFDPSLYGDPHPKTKKPPPPCCDNPYWHKIYSAVSADGITWQKDRTLIKDRASVPSAIYRDDGTIVLYYVDGEYGTMDCAVSNDGKNFSPGNCAIYGFTDQGAADPEVTKLDNGFYRMYYFAANFGRQEGEHRIMSALSKDGINWLQEKGTRYQQAGVVDPAVIKIGNEWKLYAWYYTSSGGKIVVAKSPDGLNFSKETELNLAGGVPEVVRLDSGDYALYICGLSMWVYTSGDGLNWTNGKLAIAEEKKIVCDPAPVKTPSAWMMYYKVMDVVPY